MFANHQTKHPFVFPVMQSGCLCAEPVQACRESPALGCDRVKAPAADHASDKALLAYEQPEEVDAA